MFQKDKGTNMLIMALNTLDLGDDINYVKFMDTPSESKQLWQIPKWKISFQKLIVNTRIILNNNVSVLYALYRCSIMVYFWRSYVISNSAIAKKNSWRRG